MSVRAGISIVATMVVAAAGCSDLAVRFGLRMRLDAVAVSSVSATLVTGREHSTVSALGPGQSARLVIVATDSAGKRYVTSGPGGGRVLIDSYLIEATVVQVDKRGRVSLSADPVVSEGKVGHLHITPVGHPDVATELEVPIRYDIAYQVVFSGADGASGSDGLKGLDGSGGMDAPMPMVDPTTGLPGTRGPGGPGSDGGNGGDGSNGQDGWPGGDVHVWLRLADGGRTLLQVKVQSGARQSLFIIDPNGGSLQVRADGGQGGRGGSGGRGGRGGSGGDGFPPGMSGLDGHPGSDGRAGFPGAAGKITVSVDSGAQPYLNCLKLSNRSGDGTPGPAPTIAVEPVGKLW